VPEQRISVEEAVRGYTASGAFAEFAEREKGTLEKGTFADVVVLDRDIFVCPPERIPEAKVKLTIVGGHVVYER
jgi:predicted amidohydrolase YtcJ